MSNKGRVVLGMSGGVDSSVAAYLLKQEGYEVVGVHMLMIPEKFQKDSTSIEDAKAVADQLGIEFHTVDLRDTFEKSVIRYFTDSYQAGLTPNPCVYCNRIFKFGIFAEKARELGADYISTGHYVGKIYDENRKRWFFTKGADEKKDQSYFLSLVNPDIVAKCLFPIANYTKEEIRKIAAENQIPVAEKKDSQEICFIPNDDYKAFLRSVLPGKAFRKGKIVDVEGKVLGEHESIMNYTIGQRKGLGIALCKPAYVIDIDAASNRVVLGFQEHLTQVHLVSENNNYFDDIPMDTLVDVEAKIRYRTKPAEAKLIRHADGTADVYFADPQRAVTPGQCVSYYQGNRLLGGGWIRR